MVCAIDVLYCSLFTNLTNRVKDLLFSWRTEVENNGVEPLTYCLQSSRSSQLS